MKTDDLIALLSTNVEPVDRNAVVRTLSVAIIGATVAALGIAFAGLGFRPDLTTTRALIYLAIKLAFAIGIVGLAMIYLMRLARPGGERMMSPFVIAVPFLAVVILAAISLWSAPPLYWERMIVGEEWLECLLSIPIIAIVPFAISIWAVRKAAPTNLARAGAFAGLVAGGLSAMAYALHCTDDSLPFIALWYGGTIVLCTIAGAALGPRLLRW
ncbi:DUF1109 domain-containing protein [Bradyrhizobium diazoefficiens]|nr:DUF1109 domain-containing protein [Bradyrhizobium diazoefficiens]MBR0965537.1 DUF1109 domain-containing protein [Bradyrhizobium diazoefficiens]MBR0979228.1 DUF1109 domain-containing protein [Bradyrhizobium diazoefficiens]MBR1008620.1 DUF1109 domain-containing protein [Bradyrhizobium diazoefficiens]MBR1014631.1 DUF1109 domain-containing protein [Bradyrhizobium diazoefficiens]MBR1052581.1 DUF1109 domain-containing protein [Bradyrhizobium diazoefficiens]